MGQAWSLPKAQKLFKAIQNNQDEEVSEIVRECPHAVLHRTFFRRRSCLHLACSKGATLQLATLLFGAQQVLDDGDFAAFINDADNSGNTALMLASKAGHISCIRILLEEGANPILANRRRNTALHLASRHAHSTCCHLILTTRVRSLEGTTTRAAGVMVPDLIGDERYIDVHNRSGFAPIHLAVLTGDLQTVSVLVQMGVSLDGPILRGLTLSSPPFLCGGSTALHIAAGQGNIPICRLLLEAQRRHPTHDLRRIRNMAGLTPLNMALLSGHTEVIRTLVTVPRQGRDGRNSVSLRTLFPPVLRQHMLTLLDRASLLLQLREIAKVWKSQGVGRASDSMVASVPWTLGALSPTRLAQLQMLLQREEVYLGEVVAGLEAALRVGSVDDDDQPGSEAITTITTTSVAAAAASIRTGVVSDGAAATAEQAGVNEGTAQLELAASGGTQPLSLAAHPTAPSVGGVSAMATTASSPPPSVASSMEGSAPSTSPLDTMTTTTTTNTNAPGGLLGQSEGPPNDLVAARELELARQEARLAVLGSSTQRGWQAALQALGSSTSPPSPSTGNLGNITSMPNRLRRNSSEGRGPGGGGPGSGHSRRRRRREQSDGGGAGTEIFLRRRHRMQAALWELLGLASGYPVNTGDVATSGLASSPTVVVHQGTGNDGASCSVGVTADNDDNFLNEDGCDLGDEGCQICFDSREEVSVQMCSHRLCFSCACKLCARMTSEPVSCPFCRGGIQSFLAVPNCRPQRKQKLHDSGASNAVTMKSGRQSMTHDSSYKKNDRVPVEVERSEAPVVV